MAGWHFGPPTLKWVMAMINEVTYAASNNPLRVVVTADSGGVQLNPQTCPAFLAFMADPNAVPGVSDWKAGTWEVTQTGAYTINVNPGANGANISPGTYYVWAKVDATALINANNIPIDQVGQVQIR